MGIEPGTIYLNKYTLQLQYYNSSYGTWNIVESKTGSYNANQHPTSIFYLSNKLEGKYRLREYGTGWNSSGMKMMAYDNATPAFWVYR